MIDNETLSDEQKEYLAGFSAGAGLIGNGGFSPSAGITPVDTAAIDSASAGGPVATAAASGDGCPAEIAGPDQRLAAAQRQAIQGGGRLVPEEIAKAERHPLDRWDQFTGRATDEQFPRGIDVFLTKSFGMFYVAPAQNSYMCRLRLVGGSLTSHQLIGIANLADDCAGGYAQLTTRANLQLRQIAVSRPPEVLSRLADLGIVTRGSGADNIRNITASPTSGFDRQEWYDTLPLAKQMQQYISNHREMYHLPRKFNIAFDGGGMISTLVDTNDIGFQVVRVGEESAVESIVAGTYFRVQLAGITGHQQFASDCGWLITPSQCIETAAAILRVFLAHGDRTDRRKARLKYLIDRWGMERFREAVCQELPFAPTCFPLEQCQEPPPPVAGSHLGFHRSADGTYYVGLDIPVGYMTSATMRSIARIANRYGTGQLRLTCWQNVLVPGIAAADIDRVQQELQEVGLEWQPHPVRAGLVACTGNQGCKFAAADTKRHALEIAAQVEANVPLDQPINLHLTGCHHSCAQHYIGDIGLIATKVDRGDDADEVEGYHLLAGGGFGDQQGLARELVRDLPAAEAAAVVERILRGYLQQREGLESFSQFVRRHEAEALRQKLGLQPTLSAS